MPVIVLDSVITHTSTWFLGREIHQLVSIEMYLVKLLCPHIFEYVSSATTVAVILGTYSLMIPILF